MIKFANYLKLMRLHQPTGIWLLLWPCWWAVALATDYAYPDAFMLGLFFVGAIAMRGAGCVINDMIDRKIDAEVERTKSRPLASGALSLKDAYILLSVLLLVGLGVASQLSLATFLICLGFFLLVCLYPLMKRLIPWPQAFLGLTFNAGAIIGWSAITGAHIPDASWILYAACIFWTLGYDTIYAHQDKKDDKRIGVQSTAVSLQEKSKAYLYAFYLLMIMLLIIVGSQVFPQSHYVYYGGLLVALLHLLWQVKTVDLDNPFDCMNKFKSNMMFGWIVFFAIVGEKAVSY
jgi:4-hydroxybenzoate polyprenyltransferase